MSKRHVDINGYWRVKENPISKVGVFDYLGSEIGADNPDKIYKVYRSQEELEKSIEHFKGVPFIDDHEFLGKGGTAPEKKGVQGVVADNVSFDYPYLTADLIIYSDYLKNRIEGGKKELSPAYRCEYVKESGRFEGEAYDYKQINIRGNHLALVDEGRTGKDVSVLDHYSIAMDSINFIDHEGNDMENENEKVQDAPFTEEQLEVLKSLIASAVTGDEKEEDETKEEDEREEDADFSDAEQALEEVEEAIEEAKEALEEVKEEPTADKKARLDKAMDALLIKRVAKDSKPTFDADSIVKQIQKRDALIRKLEPHIGVFNADEMLTADAVAQYACKKIGINRDSDHLSALEGYLQAVVKTTSDKKRPTVQSLSTNDKFY